MGARLDEEARQLELTPRQREVLSLIAAGKTNAEIAEALDISLDGAKYHVREILQKLGVDSREEAVRVWCSRRRSATRAERWLHALLAGTGLRWGLTGAAGLVATAVGIGVLVAFVGDDDPETPPLPRSTVVPSASAEPSATSSGTPEATLLSTPGILAEVASTPVDTSGWQLFSSTDVGVSLRIPLGLEVIERRWEPFIDSDVPPPTDLSVLRLPQRDLPEHLPLPNGTVVFTLVILPMEILVGSEVWGAVAVESVQVTVVGEPVRLTRYRYDDGHEVTTVGATIETGRGILALSAQVGGSAPQDIGYLVGMLQTLTVLP